MTPIRQQLQQTIKISDAKALLALSVAGMGGTT